MGLPSLPSELWMATLRHIRSYSDSTTFTLIPDSPPHLSTFKNLSLSSRLLQALAAPFLYEWLFLVDDSEKTESLVKQISASDEKAGWVRYLIIGEHSSRWKLLPASPLASSDDYRA
jgi:hypothetical protein